jgi:hypothetical protein
MSIDPFDMLFAIVNIAVLGGILYVIYLVIKILRKLSK